jgi:uncharacterized protein
MSEERFRVRNNDFKWRSGAVGAPAMSVLGRRLMFALLALVLLAGRAGAADMQPLEIVGKTGVHVFAVEVMVNDADRARGLMFRKEVPEGTGMLFDFERDTEISMWMENTYVSLDMLFIRSDGRIHRIAENTEPLSRRTVPSGGRVRAVLEVVAGTTRKLGIAPGDRVSHPMFKPR